MFVLCHSTLSQGHLEYAVVFLLVIELWKKQIGKTAYWTQFYFYASKYFVPIQLGKANRLCLKRNLVI